jgi:hypothetical protein
VDASDIDYVKTIGVYLRGCREGAICSRIVRIFAECRGALEVGGIIKGKVFCVKSVKHGFIKKCESRYE